MSGASRIGSRWQVLCEEAYDFLSQVGRRLLDVDDPLRLVEGVGDAPAAFDVKREFPEILSADDSARVELA